MIIAFGLVLLGLTLHFSTLAYTLRAYSRSRLSDALPEADREAWLDWVDDHEGELQTLTSLLRLTLNLAVVLTAWAWCMDQLGLPASRSTGLIAGLITLALLFIFSIAVPHALAVHVGEALLARSLGLLLALRILFWPLGRVSRAVEFTVRRLLGKAEASDQEDTARAEQEILDAVSEGEAYGAVDEEQKEMIESVIELKDMSVTVAMTPRTDINAVPADTAYDDVRQMILRSGHSRIPVYEGSVDHILGVLYAKDLLRLDAGEPFDARRIMRTVPYVPESKTLDDLLNEFRTTKVQIAIVLDEYGGTAGLVTIEDILEQLVGDIPDEYDQKPPPVMKRIDADTLEVDGRVHVSEINAELETGLPESEDYDTVAGFVFATLGRIPAAGEEFRHGNVRVHIVAAELRKIKRLRLHVSREPAKSE